MADFSFQSAAKMKIFKLFLISQFSNEIKADDDYDYEILEKVESYTPREFFEENLTTAEEIYLDSLPDGVQPDLTKDGFPGLNLEIYPNNFLINLLFKCEVSY